MLPPKAILHAVCSTLTNLQDNGAKFRFFITNLFSFDSTSYILAQNYVIAYVIAALRSTKFVDPPPSASNHILYDQHFDDLKTVLAY